MPRWGIKWRKFCVAYNFNWLINLLSFFFSTISRRYNVYVLWNFFHVCVSRQRPTATKWNIVQQNILIQQNVVSWWFLSMKAMLDDMIAIWVARYCVVTASQSMLIGKGMRKHPSMIYILLSPHNVIMQCSTSLCGSWLASNAFRFHS